MFLFLSYMLFNPAREMLKKRQDKVKNDIDSAEKSRGCCKLKEEYENRLREIHKEEDAL
ncbi:MAG: ATP synthase F0 subunit B [Gallintestinimicrobium sp.]